MNKKVLISLIIILVALIVGALLFFYPQKNEGKELYGYLIKTTDGEKKIENKAAGLEMKIPVSWQETPVSLSGEKYQIDFLSPEALEQTETGDIKQGCKITNLISAGKTDVKELQNKFDSENQENQPISYKSEIIKVSGVEALKSTVEDVPGTAIAVEVPVNEKLYTFVMYPGAKSLEKCVSDFSDFLETVSIK